MGLPGVHRIPCPDDGTQGIRLGAGMGADHADIPPHDFDGVKTAGQYTVCIGGKALRTDTHGDIGLLSLRADKDRGVTDP